MTNDIERLQAAIAAIHNHLHSGDVNAAHDACECAMAGGNVSQPNLTLSQSAKLQVFSARFNELGQSMGMSAAFIALLPSATVPGATSIQIGGHVSACKVIEQAIGRYSVYRGEHGVQI